MNFRLWAWLLGLALVGATEMRVLAADADVDKTALAVEALGRLQGVDINANPKLKEAIFRVLEKTRGTANFVKLVQQFKLAGQEAGLVEVAAAQPSEQSGVEAIRLLLAGEDRSALKAALVGTNSVRVVEALGNSMDKHAVPLLMPLVTDPKLEKELRQQAVKSIARTAEGAGELLTLAKAGKLDDALKPIAAMELSGVRWTELRAEAAKVLLPVSNGKTTALPPIAELVTRVGDAARGEKVYHAENPGCANCHVVRGRGKELGPNLSEIGTKLGKDALYQAILEPSAGISFGFEAWNFSLKDDEDVYGLVASETADEVSVKAVGGIITKLKKSEITGRQQSKLSIMPAGLADAITSQDLVDLVEFLSTLKKP